MMADNVKYLVFGPDGELQQCSSSLCQQGQKKHVQPFQTG